MKIGRGMPGRLNIRPIKSFTQLFAAITLAPLLWLQACTVTLAPPYDTSLVAGIHQANEEALVFFSEVSAGTTPARFPALAPKYDALIGKFSALRLQADARDIPTLGRRIAGEFMRRSDLAEICGADATACVNASPRSLDTIVKGFDHMKRESAVHGLTATEVAAFRQGYVISIDQVLTVETALQR